jgi:hypothetical protein
VSEALTLTYQEDEPLLRIKLSVGTWWDLLPVVWGCTLVTKKMKKSHSLQASLKCFRNLKLGYGTLREFSRKQHIFVLTQTQQTRV